MYMIHRKSDTMMEFTNMGFHISIPWNIRYTQTWDRIIIILIHGSWSLGLVNPQDFDGFCIVILRISIVGCKKKPYAMYQVWPTDLGLSLNILWMVAKSDKPPKGCLRPYKQWHKPSINWFRISPPSTIYRMSSKRPFEWAKLRSTKAIPGFFQQPKSAFLVPRLEAENSLLATEVPFGDGFVSKKNWCAYPQFMAILISLMNRLDGGKTVFKWNLFKSPCAFSIDLRFFWASRDSITAARAKPIRPKTWSGWPACPVTFELPTTVACCRTWAALHHFQDLRSNGWILPTPPKIIGVGQFW